MFDNLNEPPKIPVLYKVEYILDNLPEDASAKLGVALRDTRYSVNSIAKAINTEPGIDYRVSTSAVKLWRERNGVN